MHDTIMVLEDGKRLTFTFDAINTYHGRGFPGGVTHALKAMQAAFPLLADGEELERREISILTAFSGPGGRDCMEMVTRAVSDSRLIVDKSIGGKDVISEYPGPYVWRYTYRGKTVEAKIKPGYVLEEFVTLGAMTNRTPEQHDRHEALKLEMTNRLMPLPATEIYTAEVIG